MRKETGYQIRRADKCDLEERVGWTFPVRVMGKKRPPIQESKIGNQRTSLRKDHVNGEGLRVWHTKIHETGKRSEGVRVRQA